MSDFGADQPSLQIHQIHLSRAVLDPPAFRILSNDKARLLRRAGSWERKKRELRALEDGGQDVVQKVSLGQRTDHKEDMTPSYLPH
ncbi:hypothetical protein N7532_001515 [Penicillium argentinense]|uniref:Uncharacterized protein n=1 Tax=Penicillium argentinense TaxID=1131581 RepID=A0A9W9G2M5_9EURO|nr:uncharacterized protein N7532_001515 [Penicillium argentinense]KAJ5110980.1 hypothetical protein N7532_001515 [Penicillium argentinense]